MSSRAKQRNGLGAAFMFEHRRERGVTILIVAIGMISMLAMLALGIDIVSLYVAEGDAQRTADAAALAGAKVFVSSGFTSGQLGDPTSGTAQGLVCNGSSGLADLEAQAVAAPNLIAGVAATTVTTSCTWGARIISVTRSAKAEAYNPSGQSVPIQVHSVKPWLIPNGGVYFDTTTYNIVNNGSLFIGKPPTKFSLNSNLTTPPLAPTAASVKFYAIDIPITPRTPVCPSTNAVSCSNLGAGSPPTAEYEENIGCSGMYSVKSTDQIGPASPISPPNSSPMTMISPVAGAIKNGNATINGTQCLIHADSGSVASGSGQDTINPGAPVTISGGYNNPNPAFQNALSISRSDSVVTVPVYNDNGLAPCTGPPVTCNQQLQIIGFLQLGIQYVDNTGNIYAVILNAAGSNPANVGTPPISGGEVSPIPVRLIQ